MLVLICSFALVCLAGCPSGQAVKSDSELTTQDQLAAEEATALAEETAREQALLEELLAEADSFNNIHFAFDKYDLNLESRNVLGLLAEWLQEHTDFNVTIEGHCDDRGTIAYNLALGERRADAAKAYLVNLGVTGGKIATISYGEELPVDPRNTPAAWAKNRRDHFIVFPQKQ